MMMSRALSSATSREMPIVFYQKTFFHAIVKSDDVVISNIALNVILTNRKIGHQKSQKIFHQ